MRFALLALLVSACASGATGVAGDVAGLVSADSPFTRDWWNDLVGRAGGGRRRSYEDVTHELGRLVLGDGAPGVA
jgi:hypothetical protein